MSSHVLHQISANQPKSNNILVVYYFVTQGDVPDTAAQELLKLRPLDTLGSGNIIFGMSSITHYHTGT